MSIVCPVCGAESLEAAEFCAACGRSLESKNPDDDCPLPVAAQNWNILCYAAYWAVYYLASPVTYIGSAHANLLKELGNSKTVCNLPSSWYMWCTIVPVLAAWLFPQPRLMKPLSILSVLVMAAATMAVPVTLWAKCSPEVITNAVILHGALFGAANGIAFTSLWDFLRRGVSTSRRGKALGITFGAGPALACLGALIQDSLFQGQLLGGWTFGLAFPQNYAVLFALCVPPMCVAAYFLGSIILPPIPTAENEGAWKQFRAGLTQFRSNRNVVLAIIIYVIVYSGGNGILVNASLYTKEILGESSETLGTQNFLRFGCKAIAGALLGLLLAKTNPRATLVATTVTLLVGMGWALGFSGWWYMATFGILGAGELFGAHFPNYVATASAKPFVRVNMAYLSVLSVLVGFSSLAYGQIADAYGLKASFYAAAGLLVLSLMMIFALLPRNPTPREDVQPL